MRPRYLQRESRILKFLRALRGRLRTLFLAADTSSVVGTMFLL